MRPLLFIHIPKTAGVSISNSFLMQERFRTNPADRDIDQEYDRDQHVTFGHVKIEEARRHGFIQDADWHNYYKFCFVRNPYDRIVSLYEYLHKKGESFASFVFNLPNVEEVGFFNVNGWSQCRPQSDWIPEDIDYIGKLETLEADVERICEIAELDPPKIMHLNKTLRREAKDYREYFEDSGGSGFLREQVEGFYEKDLERFHYTF